MHITPKSSPKSEMRLPWVLETHYIATLDRLERLAGRDWVDSHIDRIIDNCQSEWKDLGLGTFNRAEDTRRSGLELVPADGLTYLPLPVDTANFDDTGAFKWSLLEAVSRQIALDDALDGAAIRSDNWQALNMIGAKYREQVKCIYIDPPYNTDSSGIPYKNGYRHASWGALMHNRIELLRHCLSPDGAIFVSIDKTERTQLEHILDSTFGASNRIEELIWAMNTNNGQVPNYSTNHEYVQVYAKHKPTVEQDRDMFRDPKPGFDEVMDLVQLINPDYPPVSVVEAGIRALYERRKIVYRDEVEALGLDWDEEKTNDPWRGIYNYCHAEYRDAQGRLVSEDAAKSQEARIWVWQEDNTAMPATKQSDTTRDPDHPNWRFYKPLHPVTGKECPHPKSGWKFAYADGEVSTDKRSFVALDRDHRIVWGEDENKVPRLKRMLHEVASNVGKSVFRDYSDGEKQTSAMFGKSGVFLAPKHTDFVSRFILQGSKRNSIVLDCFGGSGSTAHAVMAVNHLEKSRRKFITVEVNRYFDTLILPRLKKAGAVGEWRAGKAKAIDGPGLFMRVQVLEQYEDTLENLDLADDAACDMTADLPFEDPAWQLSYRLHSNAQWSYSNHDHFLAPFGYRIKQINGAGEAQPKEVDLVESLVYLLGIDITCLYREPEGVVISGFNRRGESVAVFFRDVRRSESQAWTRTKLAAHPADRVFTNNPASLCFDGAEIFESIEEAFAAQFEDA